MRSAVKDREQRSVVTRGINVLIRAHQPSIPPSHIDTCMSSPSHFHKCTQNHQCPYKASIPSSPLIAQPSPLIPTDTRPALLSPNHHRHTSSHLSPLTLTSPIPTHTHLTNSHSHSPYQFPLTLTSPIPTHTYLTYPHSHSPHLFPLTLTSPIPTHTHLTNSHSHSPHQFPLTLTSPIPTHTYLTYPHSHSPHLFPLTLTSPIPTHTHLTYPHSRTLTSPFPTHTHLTYPHSHSPLHGAVSSSTIRTFCHSAVSSPLLITIWTFCHTCSIEGDIPTPWTSGGCSIHTPSLTLIMTPYTLHTILIVSLDDVCVWRNVEVRVCVYVCLWCVCTNNQWMDIFVVSRWKPTSGHCGKHMTLSRVRFTTSPPSTITSPDLPSPLSPSISSTELQL